MSDDGGDCGGDCGGDYGADDYTSTDYGTSDYSHHDSHDVHTSHDNTSHSHAYEDHSSDSHAHQHDHSSEQHAHLHHEHSSSELVPSYEDAIPVAAAVLHHSSASHNNHDRHCCTPTTDHPAHCPKGCYSDKCDHDCRHHPHKHTPDHSSLEIYNQQDNFDNQAWNTDRRYHTAPIGSGRGFTTFSKTPQVRTGSTQRMGIITKCYICLIASFLVIVILVLLFVEF